MDHVSAPHMSAPAAPGLLPTGSDTLARLFAGLSDPARLHILLLLLEQERNVSELVSLVGSAQSRVSTHRQCLRWCDFVTSERRGKYVFYRVRDPWFRELVQLAQELVNDHGAQLATCAVPLRETTPTPS